jgi:hypothetical protein
MDSSTTGTGVDGNEFDYYVGHPTEGLPGILGLENNYANKVVVPTNADLTYSVNMVLLNYQAPGTPPPPQGTGLTPADVQRMVMEASSIWEQVGVRLVLSTTTSPTVTAASQWDLPNDDASTLTAVTRTSRANGLDIFVVNSMNTPDGPLNGSTAYENRFGVGNHETGSVIALQKLGSGLPDISAMARTLAHEVGHLIFNSGSHDPKLWNVMRDGSAQSADNDNADLRLIDRDNISILPNSYNVDETW